MATTHQNCSRTASPSSSIENMSLSQLPHEIAKFPRMDKTETLKRDNLKVKSEKVTSSKSDLHVPEVDMPLMGKTEIQRRNDEVTSDTASLGGTSNDGSEDKPNAYQKWAKQVGIEFDRTLHKEDSNIKEIEKQMKPKVIKDSSSQEEIVQEGKDAEVPEMKGENEGVEGVPEGGRVREGGEGGQEFKLTEEMVKEEEEIAAETRREEEEYQRQKDEVMKDMSEETKEKRYKRLCFLLNKCNSYADYLVVRMAEHAEENKRREEKRARKLERRARKEAEKKRQNAEALAAQQASFAVSSQDSTNDATKNGPSITVDNCTENPSKSDDECKRSMAEALGLQSSQNSRPGSRRSSRRSSRAPSPGRLEKSQDSRASSPRKEEASQEASQDSQSSDTGRRGVKRSPPQVTVSDFIVNESRRKRAKLEESRNLVQAKLFSLKSDSQGSKDSQSDSQTPQISGNSDDGVVDTRTPSTDEEKAKLKENYEKLGGVLTDHNNNGEEDKMDTESQETTQEEDADMRIINGEMVPAGQPILFEGGVLRKYQMDGFMWLNTMFENGTNGILADEMGLGKTVQVIATIADMVMNKVYGSFIVVAPLSTLPNWMSEFKRFAPRLPVFLYHGSERKPLRKQLNDWYKVRGTDVVTGIIIVTSYEMAMNDSRWLKNSQWKYMVIDEGHRLKNFKCRLIKELSKYDVVNRVLLTGTPLQNNMTELWALLNFLLPEIFMDLEVFESWFDMEALSCDDSTERIIAQERKTNILSMLHQILTPFILRRLKQDVDLVIPPKREMLVYAPLTKLQHFYYAKTINRTIEQFVKDKKWKDGVVDELPADTEYTSGGRPKRQSSKRKINYKAMIENEKDVSGPTKERFDTEKEDAELDDWIREMDENRKIITGENAPRKTVVDTGSNLTINIRNTMMLLRKCVNHPYLLEYPLTEDGQYRIDEDLIDAGGKLLILDRMLPELKKRGHKILLFSQMTSVLDILEDYCYLKDYQYSRLDGTMNLFTRQQQMDNFRTDPARFLFLLSTKAGGLGLNLTAADTVIIYDSDWNPQGDLQAQDRCHRIGQTSPVVVYRLVTARTIDEKMIERAATKRKLEKMIIHQEKFKNISRTKEERTKALDTRELVGMLSSHEPDTVFDSHRQSVMSNRVLQQLLDRQELYDQWLENMDGKKASHKAKPAQITKDVGVAGSFQIVAEDTEDKLRF